MSTGVEQENTGASSDLPEDLQGDLAGRDLRGRKLSGLSFRGRDLSGVQLAGALLVGADLRDCGLSSANLSGANLTKARLDGSDLSGADLTHADLSQAQLGGAVLERAVLHDSILREAQVQNASWNEADVRGGDWTGVDLSGAGFHRVHLVDVNLRKACLDGAELDDSDVIRVRLEEARMGALRAIDTTFEDVDLRGAGILRGEIRFANFERVDFTGADLSQVQLESVAFKGCTFDGISAAGASLVRCAGLRSLVLDQLRAAGADVALPLVVRLWRSLSQIRGGRVVVAAALVLLVLLGGYRVWDRLKTVPEDEVEVEFLLGADDLTRQEWLALKTRYEAEPEARHEILVLMAERLERLGFSDEAERRLREAVALIPEGGEQIGERLELNGKIASFLIRQGRHESARTVAVEVLAEARTGEERSLGQSLLVQSLLGAGQELIEQREYDLAFDYARAIIDESDTAAQQAPGYLLMAQARVGMGDTEGALLELSQLTTHFGTYPEDSVQLRMEGARLLEKLGEISAALSLLQGIPRSLPVEERAEAELLRAEILMTAGNALLAIRVYDGMVDRYADFPLIAGRAREIRARALTAGPDLETQRQQLESLTGAEDPELAVEGELGLARLSLGSGDREGAIERYEAVLEGYKSRPELTQVATRELAELHVASGDVGLAAQVLEVAEAQAQEAEHRVELREDLADIWQAAGDYALARAPLERTLREFSDNPAYVTRAQLHLAGIHDRAGDVATARKLYRKVAAADMDPLMTGAAIFGEATLLRRIGQPDDALPLMDQALVVLPRQNPFRGVVAVERAELLVEVGRGSVGEIESMLAEARDVGFDQEQPVAFAEFLLLLANEMQAEERHEDALRIYQRVGSSGEASAEATLRQASLEGEVAALVALGRSEQADRRLDEVQEAPVRSAEASEGCEGRLSLARGRSETGDVEGMATEFTELLETCRSPRFLVENLSVMADLLVQSGAQETAVELLTSVRDDVSVPAGRQAAELELGRLGSVEDLRAAAEGPDPALASLALVARGEQLAEEGRLAEAEPLWLKVVGDESAEPVPRSLALLGLARLESARGSRELAQRYLDKVRELAADPWLIQQAEQVELGLGQADSTSGGTPEPTSVRPR